MKGPQKIAATLAVLLLVANGFPVTAGKLPEDPALPNIVSVSGETLPQKPVSEAAEYLNAPSQDQMPPFGAYIKQSWEGYAVRGIFTEFLPDTISVLPIYSLDGENWQPCPEPWKLTYLDSEDSGELALLQDQICLYNTFEPLKSYLEGTLDRFYLKLHITREHGISYETQAAVIERGGPQNIPDGIMPTATFPSSMLVIDKTAKPFRCYGRYQLTVCADATPDEIAALLPNTLPVEVHLSEGLNAITSGIVDCPVQWKPLSLSGLIAGESVNLFDAAEEIVVPAGTLLNTPTGIFRLDQPLGITEYPYTDEIDLVLNVIPADENPAGVLADNYNGLEMAFHLKPTGATAIQAYVLSLGESKWKELPGLSLLQAIDAQPSTKNSGYTLLLSKESEPYRSYLSAAASGSTPTPFFIGLKIEGGIYDGKQLILPYPGTYELPPDLAVLGSGGNEDNAGTDNKGDSTEEGQRPNLPHPPADEEEGKQPSELLPNPTDQTETATEPYDLSSNQNSYENTSVPCVPAISDAAQPVTMVPQSVTMIPQPLTASSETDRETDALDGITTSDRSLAEDEMTAAPIPANKKTGSHTETGKGKMLLAVAAAAITIAAAGIAGFFLFRSSPHMEP